MSSSTPGATPARSDDATIAAHLAAIGVVDLNDAIETPLTPLTDDRRPRSGLIVRGARGGGSPFLNFVTMVTTWGVGLLLLALLGGLGWLGVLGVRGWKKWHVGHPAITETMVLPVGSAVSCTGRPGPGTPDAVRVALAVVAGTSVMPRDPNELRTIPGARSTQDAAGNRVDVFQPAGASLAVRYQGKTATVRTVSVRLTTAAPPCAALAMVGAITGPARVRADSAGRVWPVDGAIAPAWARGIVVRLADPSQAGVALVQMDARTP